MPLRLGVLRGSRLRTSFRKLSPDFVAAGETATGASIVLEADCGFIPKPARLMAQAANLGVSAALRHMVAERIQAAEGQGEDLLPRSAMTPILTPSFRSLPTSTSARDIATANQTGQRVTPHCSVVGITA